MKLFIIILRHYIMKIFRIKNDLPIEWTVKRLGKPETLAGKELKVFLTNIYGDTEIKDYLVQDNVIRFVFEGAAQKIAGKYGLKLIENQDGEGMVTIEACDAFCLTDGCVDTCNDNTLAVKSNIVVPANGLSAYEIAVLHGYEGTEEEFPAWLRQPAVKGAELAINAAQEALKSKQQADISSKTAMESAQKAIESATEVTNATNAAKESSETANKAASDANEAARKANEATQNIEQSLKNKQDKLDDTLETEDKSITGAINELQKSKQGKLSAGTGIAISDDKVSVSLSRNSMTPIRSGEDLDDITIPGIYCSQSNPVSGILNIPEGLDKAFVMFVAETGNVNEYVQLIIGSYVNNDMFIRGCYNNANWQAWQQVSTSVNFSKLFGSSMRSLYEACGAVWNEETGYYELNGLTDITEEEMMWIYIETFGWWHDWGPVCRYCRHARTNLRPQSYGIVLRNTDVLFPFGEGLFETISLVPLWSSNPEGYSFTVYNNIRIFSSCRRLKEITGKIRLIQGSSLRVFHVAENCPLLKEIRVEIYNDTDDIIFCKESPLLSYESMQYLVDNASNTQAIIVTINPVTYSYLSGTVEPSADVGGTTEEWQALMTAAAGKQISFATEE